MRSWIQKLIVVMLFLSPATAFAFLKSVNHSWNVLGYGGYSVASDFSDATLYDTYGNMTGYHGGGALLLTLTSRPIAPVFGLGVNYLNLTSSTQDESAVYTYKNNLVSLSAVGHAGLRARAKRLKLFFLGNYGMDLDGQVKSEVTQSGIPFTTIYRRLKKHTFYGVTTDVLVTLKPKFQLGVGAIYNLHSATFEPTSSALTTRESTFQEVSGNIVFCIGL